MLTKEEVMRVIRMPREEWTKWFERLPPTEWIGLARCLRELKASASVGVMPASAVRAMTDVVDDRLMADIVNDNRHGVPVPSGLAGPSTASGVVKATGWQNPVPLESPPGIQYIDQMIDVQDALDRRELERKLKGG